MFIYKITNTTNGKVYFGQTKRTVKRRWAQHVYRLRHGTHSNAHLQSAWNHYGESTFSVEEVDFATSEFRLNELEQQYIILFQSTDQSKGYNQNIGGQCTRTTTKRR